MDSTSRQRVPEQPLWSLALIPLLAFVVCLGLWAYQLATGRPVVDGVDPFAP